MKITYNPLSGNYDMLGLGNGANTWTDYPLTISATTTAPTKGTTIHDKARYMQDGKLLHIRYDFQQGGSGGANGSGAYLFSIPTGFTPDIPAYGTGFYASIGSGRVHNGTNNVSGMMVVVVWDGTYMKLLSDGADWIDNGWFSLAENDISYSFTVVMPIS